MLNKQREEIDAIEAELNPLLEKLAVEKDEAAKKELEAQVNTLQAKKSAAQKFAFVKQDLRLDNRVIDLRVSVSLWFIWLFVNATLDCSQSSDLQIAIGNLFLLPSSTAQTRIR